jgi:hypothetical protein
LSLILEALKKLEREKSHPDRGFLVLGAQPDRPHRRAWLAVAGVTALAALVGAAVWLARPGSAPSPPEVSAGPSGTIADVASPAAAPTMTPVVAGGLTRTAAAAAPVSLPGESGAHTPAPPSGTQEKPHAQPSPQAMEPPFRLEAISRRDGEPVAILNGRLVREGDRLGSARVVRIGELEVVIEVDGTRSVLGF